MSIIKIQTTLQKGPVESGDQISEGNNNKLPTLTERSTNKSKSISDGTIIRNKYIITIESQTRSTSVSAENNVSGTTAVRINSQSGESVSRPCCTSRTALMQTNSEKVKTMPLTSIQDNTTSTRKNSQREKSASRGSGTTKDKTPTMQTNILRVGSTFQANSTSKDNKTAAMLRTAQWVQGAPLRMRTFQNNIPSTLINPQMVDSMPWRSNISQDQTTSIPAINLHDAHQYQEILREINKYVSKQFYTKLIGSSIKITLTDQNDFGNLTSYYKQMKYSYHICNCINEQNYTVAIKGVPHSLSEDEVKNILIKQFPVVQVIRIISNVSRKITSTCCVEVRNTTMGKQIINLEYLLHTKVSVEQWRLDKVTPCKNCQKYSRDKSATTICTICKGDHNYLLCPKRKKKLDMVNKKSYISEKIGTDNNWSNHDGMVINKNDKTNDFPIKQSPTVTKEKTDNPLSINESTNFEEKLVEITREHNRNGNHNNTNDMPSYLFYIALIIVLYILSYFTS